MNVTVFCAPVTLGITPVDCADLLDTAQSRRKVLCHIAGAASSVASLAPARAAEDAATPSAPTATRLSASWSATAGLNSDDAKFVSFDPSAYRAMRDDPSRTPLFRKALGDRLAAAEGGAASQTVLDLGTGPYALFAIMAAEQGAGKVYAVEANKDIAESARAAIKDAGFEKVITVLEGFSTEINLPENEKADLVVAEIVGSIATEEGAYATILDAHKRLIKEPNKAENWIPSRMQTWAA